MYKVKYHYSVHPRRMDLKLEPIPNSHLLFSSHNRDCPAALNDQAQPVPPPKFCNVFCERMWGIIISRNRAQSRKRQEMTNCTAQKKERKLVKGKDCHISQNVVEINMRAGSLERHSNVGHWSLRRAGILRHHGIACHGRCRCHFAPFCLAEPGRPPICDAMFEHLFSNLVSLQGC